MKIFGKTLSEYIGFAKLFLILILVVGLARLFLSLAGVPNATVKYLAMTVLVLLAVIYYSVRVSTSGFGAYLRLLPVVASVVILANLITISGIVISIATGKDNIFSAPEYSPGRVDGKTWGHVGGHVIAMIAGSVVLWGIGCLIMLVTRKLTGGRQPKEGVASA